MRHQLVLIVLCLFHFTAIACDCATKPSIGEAIKKSKLIFIGKVIKLESVKAIMDGQNFILNPDSSQYEQSPYQTSLNKYLICIEELYKGKPKIDTVAVYSFYSAGSCGFAFDTGTRYVVYAEKMTFKNSRRKKAKVNFTSSCMRTAIFSNEERALLQQKIVHWTSSACDGNTPPFPKLKQSN